MTLTLGWFATGTGTTSPKLLAAALDAIHSGRLDARIAVVFCNREPGEDPMSDGYHEQVRAAGIPLVTLSDRRFRREHGGEVARKGEALPGWRRAYDREVMRLLEPYPFDLGVLAGYKLIFCEEAAAKWDLLNLHPAEPGGPAGIWQDVIWRLIETRADRAGVMMHLATPELDEGPPVTYCTYRIRGPSFEPLWQAVEGRSIAEVQASEGEENALFQEIRRQGVSREIPLVIATLQAFADGRVRIAAKRPVDAGGHPVPPHDLSETIERTVKASVNPWTG
ncbi:MAG TPA: formyltransferase family protein [Dehalococcoidia bacterium]|nr:formyltransferase family protein [Dehalococcoidia bacterium]